jgi:stress response protein YsnF
MSIPHRSGDLKISLQSEEVIVSRHEVTGDTVRIGTVTREHDHHIDESLTHTRVDIERVPVGRLIESVPPVREEGDTTVLSVVAEVVVIERRQILKEEVRIRRVQVAERYQDIVASRRQDVTINRIEAPSVVGGDDTSPSPSNLKPPCSQEKI